MSTEEIEVRIRSYEFGKRIGWIGVASEALNHIPKDENHVWEALVKTHLEQWTEAMRDWFEFRRALSEDMRILGSQLYYRGYFEAMGDLVPKGDAER